VTILHVDLQIWMHNRLYLLIYSLSTRLCLEVPIYVTIDGELQNNLILTSIVNVSIQWELLNFCLKSSC